MAIFNHLLRLARPKQWSKNLLVFAAFLFGAKWADPQATLLVIAAFVAMCLASSATYVLNDLFDRERDRQHPVKKNRPIAAGLVSTTQAGVFGFFLLLLAGGISLWVGWWVFLLIVAYLAMQILYNLFIKKVPVGDVFFISLGFVLRAVLGAQAIEVPISGWLLFCTGGLALMLGFAKRRQEFISQAEDMDKTRENLVHYTKGVLDTFVALFAGVAIMSYGVYCLGSQTAQTYPGLLMTLPFVVYGVSRYMLVVFTQNEGGEPADLLFRDGHVVFSLVGFIIAAIAAVGGKTIPIVGN
ncbi:MAG: UbiA prenyltransferase family protein [Fimbriimonadaceae bacterium]|jgi:4-hydroxybenzoate polyprenyltransferase|nr:UbiA prenyltransferase family protein [Fimbriimonadaceae bacterium]